MIHIISNSNSLNLGGAEKIVFNLHKSLIEHGQSVQLLSIYKGQEYSNTHLLKLQSPYSLSAIWGVARYARQNIKGNHTVHVHMFPASFYCSFLKFIGVIKAPMILTEHSTYNNRRDKWWGKLIDAFMYKRYKKIVAISEGAMLSLIKWHAHVKPKIQMIHNGVHLKYADVIERKDKDEIIVLSVGNLRKAKNYDTALKAFSEINNNKLKWLVLGDGPEYDGLIKLRDQLELQDVVSFEGKQRDIYPYLEKADIFLMPSRYEGFGLAAVEAMNASLPLILSKVEGLSEITNSDSAIFVDPLNHNSISDAIEKLASEPELRKEMGRISFLNANQFSNERMYNNYMKLYND